MEKYNSDNERIKRSYLRFQQEACHKAERTITGILKAINRFENYTKYKKFSTFNMEQAIGFKKQFSKQKSLRTGEQISKATLLATLNTLKDFFRWLSCQSGFKSKINLSDIEYFNLSDNDMRIAKSCKLKDFPTIEQVKKTLSVAPYSTQIERRDRALFAMAFCTGMRDDALASLRLRHIDINKDPILIKQEPDLVRTKFRKSILTYLFPISDEITEIIIDWIRELREEMLYGINDPVFPRTLLGHDKDNSFIPIGLERVCWSSAAPIRTIFRKIFENADLPYFKPHRCRDTLTHLGLEICRTPEQIKALSQNLGHSSILTTLSSYGNIEPSRQGEIIGALNQKKQSVDLVSELQKLLERHK